MRQARVVTLSTLMVLLCSLLSQAQQNMATAANGMVPPPLIQFSNVATDEGGNSMSGMVNITFSLYTAQQGGEPLWTETQNNVQLDPTGHYSVQLGITKPAGVPTTLFTTGEARWLGVQVAEQAEQPRVLLLSVPYALKAGDAATIGGLPPSAFVLAVPQGGTASAMAPDSAIAQSAPPPSGAVTGAGTVNYLPLWDSTSDIISSVLFQKGTGTTAKVGIGTATPASTLDVKGGSTVRGTLSLPATGTATATAGKNSQALSLAASAFSGTTSTAVTQSFDWQAEPAGNDTSTPSGTLNLLFGEGTAKPSETGLNIASNGRITFAAGQTFPGTGTGNGTVTSVASGTGLTGGPITTSGSLAIDPTVVPQLAVASNTFTGSISASSFTGSGAGLSNVNAAMFGGNPPSAFATTGSNIFTGNQTVNGNLSASGLVTGSGFQIGSNLFAFGSYANTNAFLGFAGNSAITGVGDTASGYQALFSDTTGGGNTASGVVALFSNTSGSQNTASGASALQSNATGSSNTATGYQALYGNTAGTYNTASGAAALGNSTGSSNTASGGSALYSNSTGSNNTAFGYQAGNTTNSLLTTGSNNTFLGSTAGPGTLTTLSNATAIGATAEVQASNSMVLGSINGINGATANTNVGIGTTTPAYMLDVHGTGNFTGLITFASGQTFPGTLSASGNQTITGNLSDTGNVAATGSISGQTGSFSGSNSSQIVNVTESGNGIAINATSTSGVGINAVGVYGVEGGSSATGGAGVFAAATGASGFGVLASSSGTNGYAVYGEETNSTGTNYGVYGFNGSTAGAGVAGHALNSLGTGVLGQGSTLSSTSARYAGVDASGVWGDTSAASGTGFGVLATADNNTALAATSNGFDPTAIFTNLTTSAAARGVDAFSGSPSGAGIFSQAYSSSESLVTVEPVGIWGDTGGSLGASCPAASSGYACGVAILGTVINGNAFAGFSSDGFTDIEDATAFLQNNAGQGGALTLATWGGTVGGSCTINVSGDLKCNGTITGVVDAGGAQKVALYAVEAPENWFEDFGSGLLANGSAVVALEPTFAQTVNTGADYHVFLTPKADCKGLYVTNETANGFEVRELGGGTSNAAFDYRIVAKRKGYESVRLADMTQQFKVPERASGRATKRVPALPTVPIPGTGSPVRPVSQLRDPPVLNRK